MVPKRVKFIDKMPLTNNGKADRGNWRSWQMQLLHLASYMVSGCLFDSAIYLVLQGEVTQVVRIL